MYYKNLWLFLGVMYIGLIVASSLLNLPEIKLETIDHTDKIIHFGMYFILVGWFTQIYKQPDTRIIILLCAICLGMLIEYLQGMTAYRSFDLYDEIANSIGACCAFILSRTSFDTLLSKIDAKLHQQLN